MSKNDGKAFEKLIRDKLKTIRNVSVDRINDNVGYAGAYNIADLIVYRKPCKFYLELKTIKGTSFPFSNINLNALMDMQYAQLVDGVGCYFIIWFKDLDKTIAISSEELYIKIHGYNKKSIGVNSFKDFEFIEVNGKKKRKFYDYDLEQLLDKLERDVLWLK